jgi:DNA-directed RNA polymerase specialized sigma24 family protein
MTGATQTCDSAETRDFAETAGLDLEAIGRLFAGFSKRLLRTVRGVVECPDAVAEDACQFAWSGLLQHRARVCEETAQAWLLQTAIREAVRLTRRCAREPSLEHAVEAGLEPAATTPEPWELLAHRERVAEVRELADRPQRFVWLRALGFSYEEMAAREHCTPRTVERQLARARLILHGGVL